MNIAEQSNNTHLIERVDAQTQTDTSTAEDLTLSQKLTAIAHHELESAAPPSRTTSLDKFDKDILRWKDVHFLRDFGDWFNPEKAVQPTYTRLLASCGYLPPLDPVEGNSPPLDSDPVDGHSPPLHLVETSNITNQGERALVSPDTNVEKDVGQCFVPESGDATVVDHTDTTTTTVNTDTDTDTMTNTQTAKLSTHSEPDPVTVTVRPGLDDANIGDIPTPNLESDSDSTILPASSMN